MDTLRCGRSLADGQQMTSANGKFALRMQADGDLVLYDGTLPIWATGTAGSGVRLSLSEVGLRVGADAARPLWEMRPPDPSVVALVLRDDGDLVLYSGTGDAIWTRRRGKPPMEPTSRRDKSGNARRYTVARGDSLWKIAEKVYGNGTEYRKIVQANDIADPDYLETGQQLVIPE